MKDEKGREVVFQKIDMEKEEVKLMEEDRKIVVNEIMGGSVKKEELEYIMTDLVNLVKEKSPDMPLGELKIALSDAITRQEAKKDAENK